MADYLYLWNPKRWEWKDFHHAVRLVGEGRGYEDTWSCGGTKAIRPGDPFLLHRVGVEPRGIWGCGVVLTAPAPRDHWDPQRAAEGDKTLSTYLLFQALDTKPLVPLAELEARFPAVHWGAQVSGTRVDKGAADWIFQTVQQQEGRVLGERDEMDAPVHTEGGRRIVTRATYDRSAAARLACLEAWGFDCAVCGFNFGMEYGDIGQGYIEVHHLRPLAAVGEAHPVNPVDDLRPVCANCHRMLHHGGEVRSISELKDHRSAIAEGGGT